MIIIDILQTIFERDLDLVIKELNIYPDEALIWKIDGDVNNGAGNLCLHLIGNLQYFIGTILGKSDFQRDRESEFTRKDVPREDLIKDLEATKLIIKETLNKLSTDRLTETFPIKVLGYKMTTGFFLVHLATHLNYHLGQLSYHRRIFAA